MHKYGEDQAQKVRDIIELLTRDFDASIASIGSHEDPIIRIGIVTTVLIFAARIVAKIPANELAACHANADAVLALIEVAKKDQS